MHTIKQEEIYELVIQKSTFISCIAPVLSLKEAKAYFQNIRQRYPNASHYVTAYRIGQTGEYGHYNDDREPSGTAGFPIFEVLRKNDLTNIACVVVRYFGGIKLGAGGLARAYGKAVSENLQAQQFILLTRFHKLHLSFHYAYLGEIEILLKDFEIIKKDFTACVGLFVLVPEDELSKTVRNLTELTAGSIKITKS